MSNRIPSFTPNEILVIRALYKRNKPSTIREIAEEVTGEEANCFSRGYQAVRETLPALVSKGLVKRDDRGKNLKFVPAKSLQEFLQDQFTELGLALAGKLPRGFRTAVEKLSKKFT